MLAVSALYKPHLAYTSTDGKALMLSILPDRSYTRFAFRNLRQAHSPCLADHLCKSRLCSTRVRPSSSWKLQSPFTYPTRYSLQAALAWLGCFLSILLVGGIFGWVDQQWSLPLMLASFGPTAALLYGSPKLPAAQPWNAMGGASTVMLHKSLYACHMTPGTWTAWYCFCDCCRHPFFCVNTTKQHELQRICTALKSGVCSMHAVQQWDHQASPVQMKSHYNDQRIVCRWDNLVWTGRAPLPGGAWSQSLDSPAFGCSHLCWTACSHCITIPSR